MCIAILNATGSLERKTFGTCWYNNPDGAGIAYVENDEVKIIKEMRSPDRLYQHYKALRQHNPLPMIVHFRIATSGLVDKENCHPFDIRPGLAMAHNGILENVHASATASDTRVFISEVLAGLPEDFLDNEAIQRLIAGFIDTSKLVFLDRHGIFHIINEHLGHWDKAHRNWFSNHSYSRMFSYSYGTHATETSGFRQDEGYQSAGTDNDWHLCEGCGNWVDTEDLRFDPFLDAALCSNCRDWYQ